MWGFEWKKHVSLMSIRGDVAPEAQTRCEKMGAVGTVVWFTIYAQTDSSAWGFKKGLRWLGATCGEITCVFFCCLLNSIHVMGVIGNCPNRPGLVWFFFFFRRCMMP